MPDEGTDPPSGSPKSLDDFTKSPDPDRVPVEDIIDDVQVEVVEGVESPDD